VIFIVGFSVGTESPNYDVCSTCVPMYVSACAKIFITYCIWGGQNNGNTKKLRNVYVGYIEKLQLATQNVLLLVYIL
jgi:hypothetical protein